MSSHSNNSDVICKAYPEVRMLGGCAMDAASYERHCPPQQPAVPSASDTAPETAPNDPFAQEQDFRAIAAQAFEQDRAAMQPRPSDAPAAEYDPEAASQCVPLTDRARIVCGSGSYLTSGSYGRTSGSYALHSDSSMQLLGGYGLGAI